MDCEGFNEDYPKLSFIIARLIPKGAGGQDKVVLIDGDIIKHYCA